MLKVKPDDLLAVLNAFQDLAPGFIEVTRQLTAHVWNPLIAHESLNQSQEVERFASYVSSGSETNWATIIDKLTPSGRAGRVVDKTESHGLATDDDPFGPATGHLYLFNTLF